nr:zinc finger, CCHC-type [Tanacetum cinerariifolium]
MGVPAWGRCHFMGSKKKTCITGSNMESEFVALAAASKEAEWLRNLIHEIPIWPKPIAPISIRCDSAPKMARAYSQIYNGKSRHLGVRHSMVRELIKNVDKTKKFLSSRFSMKDMGKAGVILDCSPVRTLMDPVEKLKPNTGKPVDQLEYSRAIGFLMYAMTSTRPDIAYAVGRLSRFTSNPSRQHWKAITRIFKYLKGTKNYGLSYVGYPSVLEGYLDASWINYVEDSSSTSGWVFLLREVAFHGLLRSKHTSLVLLWNMSL